MARLAVWGLVAAPFYIALGSAAGTVINGWWPLNILFTLLAAAGTIYLLELGGVVNVTAAGMVFVAAGAFVEYWWFGLTVVIAAWWYFKSGRAAALGLVVVALGALVVVNRNLWALGVLPLLFAASHVDLKVPRMRHLFYVFYPAHLAALTIIQHL